MSRLASRIVLACVCGVALACRHAPPSIPDQARLYAGVGRYHRICHALEVVLLDAGRTRAAEQLEQAWARSDVKPRNPCYCATGA